MKSSSTKFTNLLLVLTVLLAAGCSRIRTYQSTPAPTQISTPNPTPTELAPKTPTPYQEQPVKAMPVQPRFGVAGKDSLGDPYIPELGNTGYNVKLYNLIFDIAPEQKIITATAIISATSTLDNLGRISLDFKGFQTDGVTVNGDSVPFYRSPNKLYLDLPRPFAKDEPLTVKVNYHGEMQTQSTTYIPQFQMGFTQPKADRLFAFSEPDGARAWFPANDHPLDKAAFQIEATVPQALTAVANGDLLATDTADGKTTYKWYEEDPLATYLATLAVGPYVKIDSQSYDKTQLRYYIFQDDPKAGNSVNQSALILKFLTDLIGPYPFDEFGYVEINSPGLAMETQTMILVDQAIFDSNPSATFVHEAAHQWFGDNVSLATWGDIWLNEGFAQYFQVLWQVKYGGNLRVILDSYENSILQREQTEFAPLDEPSENNMFGTNTYLKGAWILYMLREELGDELFIKVIRTYYQRYAGGNATSADFQAVAEEVSRKDLEAFFRQWVETPGNPHLAITWTSQPATNGSQATIQVCQTIPDGTYAFPLEIQLAATDGKGEISTIQVSERQQDITVQLPFEPTILTADPNQKVLADVNVTRVDLIQPCPS